MDDQSHAFNDLKHGKIQLDDRVVKTNSESKDFYYKSTQKGIWQ